MMNNPAEIKANKNAIKKLIAISDYNGAEALLQNFLSLNTTDKDILYDYANCAMLRRDYGQALLLYASVIRMFSPNDIDLIMPNFIKQNTKYIDDLGLGKYNIRFGYEHMSEYESLICDACELTSGKTKTAKRVITLFHSMDNTAGPNTLGQSHLYILPTERHTECGTFKILPEDSQILAKIPESNKCEIAYSGPYHAAHLRHLPKEYFRKRIEEIYNISLDRNKPLVFFLEDEISYFAQNVWCANKISEFAVVVFKTWASVGSQKLKKLSSRVIILDTTEISNNDFRFASDFIMSGYISGTLCSSILLGLTVIPYYSKLVKSKLDKNKTGYKPFYNYLPETQKNKLYLDVKASPAKILLHLLMDDDMLHSLTDIDKISNSIMDQTYTKKYISRLKSYQQHAFGNYFLDGAAERTRNLILKFADTGTVGPDCSSIYVKDHAFV